MRFVNDSPAFQFYPHDWLADWAVELMTNEQLGAYLRLVCHAWHSDQPGRLPNDRSTLAGLCRMSVEWWDSNGSNIMRAFRVDKDGFITHPALVKQWERQQAFRDQKVAAGKASAAKRQQTLNERSTHVEQTGNSSASASPSGLKEREDGDCVPPTLDEVRDLASRSAMLPSDAKAFYDHYQGNNLWFNQFGKLIHWRDKLLTWRDNARSRPSAKHQGHPTGSNRNAGTYNERGLSTRHTTAELAKISQEKAAKLAREHMAELERRSTNANASGGNGVPSGG